MDQGFESRPVKKVAVGVVVLLDYDALAAGVESKDGRWSPIVEFAKALEQLPGVYEIVSMNNLTIEKTGQEFEAEEA
jgi:hypothetical protein